ncbi:MAG: DUF1553 domain-containing protein [Lentisphaeria bacterium]|nr:DUF1553 domain-containing protein [Lentisphaeria bacterium]
MLKHLFALSLLLAALVPAGAEEFLYRKPVPVAIESEVDRALAAGWKHNRLPLPPEASDAVLVRRLYLALAGRLPTPDEARAYVNSNAPDKYGVLIGTLLESGDFADYWTMHWCDALRIKSEFPINLWPNAVYGYRRRVRSFLKNNEPYDRFARSLLTSAGSNFRVPEVNFYRATADRSPAGIAKAAALTFLGSRLEGWPEAERAKFTALFEPVAFKSTKEWKEEIVYWRETKTDIDPREAVAEAVLTHPDFARALVNRVWFWFFGRGIVHEADDLRPGNAPVNPELLDVLTREFVKSGYDFRQLCRTVAKSAACRAASGDGNEAMEKCFAAFAVRRLPAEVLDDAIRDLTGTPDSYSSVIPEPFTFIPPEARTVTLADGSISSSFLILFGRPARDSGTLSERNDAVSDKQRLQLFNSGELYRRLGKIPQREELKKLPFPRKVEEFYWMFCSRPPTRGELMTIWSSYEATKKKWRYPQDLCWILLNSKEFLYQH